MTKRSIQRTFIKENLQNRCDHPTADMIYDSVRQDLPNISLGTVYRNLRFLVEQGDALSLKFDDGREHFDGNVHPHYHFVCEQCGAIEDLFMDELPITDIAARHTESEIKGHYAYFYGLCSNCKAH